MEIRLKIDEKKTIYNNFNERFHLNNLRLHQNEHLLPSD